MDPAESSQRVYAFFEKMSGRSSVTETDSLQSPTKRSRMITLKVPRHFLIRPDGNIDNPNQSISAASAHQIARNSCQIKEPLPAPPAPERLTIRIKIPQSYVRNNDPSDAAIVSAVDASVGAGTKKRKASSIDNAPMRKRKPRVVLLRNPKYLQTQPYTIQGPEKQVEDIPQPNPSTKTQATQEPFTSPKLCLNGVLEPEPVVPSTTPSLRSNIETSLVLDDRPSETTTSGHDAAVEHRTSILRGETVLPNTNASQRSADSIHHNEDPHLRFSCDGIVESPVKQLNTVVSTNPKPASETSILGGGTDGPVLPAMEAVELRLPRTEISSPTTTPTQPSPDAVDLMLQLLAAPSGNPMDNQTEVGSSHSRNIDPVNSIALLYYLNRKLSLLHRRHQFYLDEGSTLQINFNDRLSVIRKLLRSRAAEY